MKLSLFFCGLLLSHIACAQERLQINGEHGITRLSDSSETIDIHKLNLTSQVSVAENWQFTGGLSFENGYNELFPGDGINRDSSELFVETLNVKWQYASSHSLTIGRFYLPIGTINDADTRLGEYGAIQNPVETHIIPSNWSETGLMASGQITDNIDYNFSIHSALIMPDAGLVRDGRQRSSFSISKAHAFTARIQYTPFKGLLWSTSLHFEVDTTEWDGWGNNSAGLIQTHVSYASERFSSKAFFSYWDIDGYRFETSGREKQNGWYLQSGYKVTPVFGLFLRVSEWDNEQDDRDLSRIRQWDIGGNWWISDKVVIKLDFSKYQQAQQGNSINAGISWRI